jgi:glycosyltransferase involved in cell wall biosynthesis
VASDAEPQELAFCITELDPGGAERALVQLVTRLDRSRWSPVVYCLSAAGALVGDLEGSGVPVACLGARGSGILVVLPRLVLLLRKQRPVLLQTFLHHANIVGRVAGRLAGVRHIVSGIRVAEKRSRFRRWLDRVTDVCVERHVCVSHAVARFSIEQGRLPPHKVVVIPNGVDAELFQSAQPADLSELGIPPHSRTLLFVGRLDHQKGPFDLLRAFQQLAQRLDDLHVLMVGDGPLRGELERAVDQCGLRSRFHLVGRRNDIPRLMKAADCLVLPSHWEGMPNVVLEAMAAGLPVVATRVEGSTELLDAGGENGKHGLLVPSGCPESLAPAIERALSGSASVSGMTKEAQHHVTTTYTWDAVHKEFEQLYTELIVG